MSNRILDHLLNDPENDIDLQVGAGGAQHTLTPGGHALQHSSSLLWMAGDSHAECSSNSSISDQTCRGGLCLLVDRRRSADGGVCVSTTVHDCVCVPACRSWHTLMRTMWTSSNASCTAAKTPSRSTPQRPGCLTW